MYSQRTIFKDPLYSLAVYSAISGQTVTKLHGHQKTP